MVGVLVPISLPWRGEFSHLRAWCCRVVVNPNPVRSGLVFERFLFEVRITEYGAGRSAPTQAHRGQDSAERPPLCCIYIVMGSARIS